MADGLKIAVDLRDMAKVWNTLGASISLAATAASKVSADNIANEARRRVARRTGLTAEGIVVLEGVHHGPGWAVISTREHPLFSWHTRRRTGRSWTQRVTQSNVPIFLEHGTEYKLARPYFWPSVRLEEGAHDRRMREAVQHAIDEVSR